MRPPYCRGVPLNVAITVVDHVTPAGSAPPWVNVGPEAVLVTANVLAPMENVAAAALVMRASGSPST
jgi:hypothetical protein